MDGPSFQTIFLSAPDAVIVIDAKGMIINWNSKAEMLFGWNAQEVIGKSLAETIIPEQYRERHREGIKHYLETGIGPVLNKTIEIEGRRRDGVEFDISLSISGSRLEDKQIFIGFIRDITLRKTLESQLRVLNTDLSRLVEEKTAEIKKSEEKYRYLVSHLQDVREEERLRIAQEIHDELGQQLTVLKMDISWLDKKLGELDPQFRERTEGIKTMLDKTVKTVRRIASELRPSILDDMGLAVAIEWHINELQKRTGLRIDFVHKDSFGEKSKEELQLPDSIKIGLYRITQEALTNVVRYANAKTVKIRLYQQSNQLHLHIGDDGTGFDPSSLAVKKTLGILGMKERASKLGGNLQLSSSPGNGTIISVMIPLPQEPIPFSPKLP